MCLEEQGEKLLNSLGGMFSKPWKPKKGKEITGPMITPGTDYIIYKLYRLKSLYYLMIHDP